MTWDPAPSLEHFEQIYRTWLPMMAAGTDVSFAFEALAALIERYRSPRLKSPE
jgi:hypothetical protein